MAIFFNGEDDPSDAVVEADILQLARNRNHAPEGPSLKLAIKQHFQGKASDEQIQRAIRNLLRKGGL